MKRLIIFSVSLASLMMGMVINGMESVTKRIRTLEIHNDGTNDDAIIHDFLYNPAKFNAIWGTKRAETGYYNLPQEVLNTILQQAEINRVIPMLKKEIIQPFYVVDNDPQKSRWSFLDKEIRDINFNPNGEQLAIAFQNNKAQIWDTIEGKLIYNLPHKSFVRLVTYNSTGTQLATASADQIVYIWDARTGKLILKFSLDFRKNLRGHGIKSVLFNPNGTQLLTIAHEGVAQLWDAETGKLMRTISGERVTHAASFNPAGTLFVTIDYKVIRSRFGEIERHEDATIKIWDAQSGDLIHEIHPRGMVTSLVFNASGTQLAAAGHSLAGNNLVEIWDIGTYQSLAHFFLGDRMIEFLEFNSDGTQLAFSTQAIVQILDTNSWQSLHEIELRDQWIQGLNSQWTQIVSKGYDFKSISIWNVPNGELLFKINLGTPLYAKFNPAGSQLVIMMQAPLSKAYILNIKDILDALTFLKNPLKIEQALLLNLIYHVALHNKLLAKKGLPAENRLDFNKFPHLQQYFNSFPIQLQRVLSKYVIRIGQAKEEPGMCVIN